MKISVLVVVLAIWVVAGCSLRPSIVGTWKGSGTTLVFTSDGHVTRTTSLGIADVSTSGTYTTTGDSVAMTYNTGQLGGLSISTSNVQAAQTYTFKRDGDTLTLTQPGVDPLVLQRSQ